MQVGYKDKQKKEMVRDHFDQLAGEREYWQNLNHFYYADQWKYMKFLVPSGLRVLDVGCGLGDLLAAVKPRRGLGIDLSNGMVSMAKQRHPDLEFLVADVEELNVTEKFDVIILSDVVGHLLDVEIALKNLRQCCTPNTRVIIAYYNFLWEPVLHFAEWVHLKMPQQQQNWLSPQDLTNLLELGEYQLVKKESRMLVPKWIPVLSWVANGLLAYLPGFRSACLCHYMVARPFFFPMKRDYSTTIVIPCRNERGNIESAIQRLPFFGGHQEIIFVDGDSRDGTQEEIRGVMEQYKERDIKLLVQEGKGKGDAVRKGFAHARGEIFMILDADLTVPPEDLPRFYLALATGKGEFINGCRLVYPMETEAMRLLNFLGNKFFSLAFSWLLNQRIKDTLCGTKVLFREDYQNILRGREYFGDFDPFGDFDLLFGASKQNLRIVEVPIRYQERRYGTTNIRRFAHGWLLLKMVYFGFFRLKSI